MASTPGGQESKSYGWVPGPLGTRGVAGLSSPLETHSHHRPILICLPFSTSTSSDHRLQAQNRRCVSNLVTNLSQCSIQLHKCMEGRGVLCPRPSGEECQWEESHNRLCVNLLDKQACHCQDSLTGVRAAMWLSPGWRGAGIGPSPKPGCLG